MACQRAKVHRHTKAPLESFTIPTRRLKHVHVDLVCPLPPSQGFTHLLTVVDRTTRWPEAVPSPSRTSEDVAHRFFLLGLRVLAPPDRFGALVSASKVPGYTSTPHYRISSLG